MRPPEAPAPDLGEVSPADDWRQAMALLRQCLNELRTRCVSPAFAAVLAGAPDTVVPPLERHEIELLLAGGGSAEAASASGLEAAPAWTAAMT
jgi:hypothetical protein